MQVGQVIFAVERTSEKGQIFTAAKTFCMALDGAGFDGEGAVIIDGFFPSGGGIQKHGIGGTDDHQVFCILYELSASQIQYVRFNNEFLAPSEIRAALEIGILPAKSGKNLIVVGEITVFLQVI